MRPQEALEETTVTKSLDHRSGEATPGRRAAPRISVVIPALNEAPSISEVVHGLRRQKSVPLYSVIVVDNGSTDGTGTLAREAGASVVREGRRGYGYACRAGVLAAEEAEVILLLDGDAADDPEDLPRVLEPLLGDEADLVVGARNTRERGSMTLQQILGNGLAVSLVRLLYGVRATDLGPFRAIRRDHLLALGMREMGYGWSVEMMVKAARAGYRYREVPVVYHRRIGVSKVGGTIKGSLLAGYSILSTVFRHARWTPEGAGSATAEAAVR